MSPALRWTAGIVGLLGLCVAAMVVLAVSAGSADSRRVLPAYDTRALDFERELTARAASAALGWTAVVDLTPDGATITLRDRAGAPVRDARVALRMFHRAHADDVLELEAAATAPGTYRAAAPELRPGIHQLELTASRGAEQFVATTWAEAW